MLMMSTAFRDNILRGCLLVFALQPHLNCCWAGIPTEPEFFPLQLVDHSNISNISTSTFSSSVSKGSNFWKQRYYSNTDHFKGPGYPILLILGGEGAISPATGIFYPVVVNVYAREFGALVLQPEHRFYGESQPVSYHSIDQARKNGRVDPRVQLFTTEQALYDAVRLTKFLARNRYGCNVDDRFSKEYCPVISIGGSYPGFMSAMARLRFPDHVDIGYAASAPMKFYAQQVPQFDYYDHITAVAEEAVSGCAKAVQQTLFDVVDYFSQTPWDTAGSKAGAVGVCPGTVPSYVGDAQTFIDELVMVVGFTFANHNMAYYPPSKEASLTQSCFTFTSSPSGLRSVSSLTKLSSFLGLSLAGSAQSCWDMTKQLPSGPNATVSSGDWSGVGTGTSGESWDWQTCTLLVESIGFGPDSMFPNRNWSLNWLNRHCQARFRVTPEPTQLVEKWKFDSLVEAGASRILFTNGLRDGWSVSGITKNMSESILALNFPNGAHHSDLNGHGPRSDDTPDIRDGYGEIQEILGRWLEELPSYRLYNKHAGGSKTAVDDDNNNSVRSRASATNKEDLPK